MRTEFRIVRTQRSGDDQRSFCRTLTRALVVRQRSLPVRRPVRRSETKAEAASQAKADLPAVGVLKPKAGLPTVSQQPSAYGEQYYEKDLTLSRTSCLRLQYRTQ